MRSHLNIALLLPGMLLLAGCYYDNEEELYPSNFCDVTAVTFSGTIKPLIQTRCAIPGCHVNGGQSPNLTVDANILGIAQNGDLHARVIQRASPAMPPTGPLPSCEMQQIQAWLDQGSPNN